MQPQEIGPYCLEALQRAGAQKAQCLLHQTEKHELNVASDRISLLRTTHNASVHLTGILDDCKGTLTINKLDQAALDQAAADVVALARASAPDSAYDIAEQQPAQTFARGPETPERDLMYDKLHHYLKYCKTTYPNTIQEEIQFDFTAARRYFHNSNGVNFTERQGCYNFGAMFTSKDGTQASSFNYSGFASKHLEHDLHAFGSLDTLLRQSAEQTTTQKLPGKMTGDLIITPDCCYEFVEFVTHFLRDYALISGTSIFKDKLFQPIADARFTLHSRPVADEIADGYYFTDDGYAAQNSTIIEQGRLMSFLLSLYGSRKTQRSRAVNDGEAYVIEPGECPLDKMIRSVRKGILLCRFSGGNPSDNGDFSGVAKNSYYIENGEIQYPLSETMLSGNLARLLHSIRQISQERINFGHATFPWIRVVDVTLSGK